MTTENIVLDRLRRGTEFSYSSSLTNGWTEAMFTGGILFTLRRVLPPSSRLDDSDTLAKGGNMVHQASVANGQITFSGDTAFTVLIPAASTHAWPVGKLFWDMQGKITIGSRVLDIAAGTIIVTPDVTRTP
jgi:hypothetical protein